MSSNIDRTLAIDFNRLHRGLDSCLFNHLVWRYWEASKRVWEHLTVHEQARLARACVVTCFERKDHSLVATARRLDIESASALISTPPIADFPPESASDSPA